MDFLDFLCISRNLALLIFCMLINLFIAFIYGVLNQLCIDSHQIIFNTIFTSTIIFNRNPAHNPRGYGPSLTTLRRAQLVEDVPGSIKTNWLPRWILSLPNSVERQRTSPLGARSLWHSCRRRDCSVL